MKRKIVCFEDLVIWQKAQQLAVKIYVLADTNEFIKKDFALKDQLKRAAISISDNIAEGLEYNNNPDFYRFLRIAKGSCAELRNKVLFIRRLGYIADILASELLTETKELGRQIGALLAQVKERIITSKLKRAPTP